MKRDLTKEVESRRTFAIISHPDAGKTTLTEKLLYYGGAIQEAGAVRARRGAMATSDWMEMEQQRRHLHLRRRRSPSSTTTSPSTSSAYPGHADFSEDTYRTVSAADNAVMLVDSAKGLEPQTRKLFEVCRLNGLPIFTFCNKMDRPALEPLELLDQIEREFDLPTYAVNWPIGSGDTFKGVYHRPMREVHLFDKDASATTSSATRRRTAAKGLRRLRGRPRARGDDRRGAPRAARGRHRARADKLDARTWLEAVHAG